MICRCGREVELERQKIGLHLCMECGDLEAAKELAKKRTRVGPVYNKGPEQYLGDEDQTKKVLVEGGGRKHIPIQYQYVAQKPGPKKVLSKNVTRSNRGKVIGMCFSCNSRRLLYEKEDISGVKGRIVLFGERWQRQ